MTDTVHPSISSQALYDQPGTGRAHSAQTVQRHLLESLVRFPPSLRMMAESVKLWELNLAYTQPHTVSDMVKKDSFQ